MTRLAYTVLAIVCAAGAVGLFVVGVSGGRSERGAGYFAGALVAILLTGVFTYLGLTTGPRDAGDR